MMQEGFDAAPSRFSVGGVVGASLSLLRRNFWQFFAVAFLIGLPLVVLSAVASWIVTPTPLAAAGLGAKVLSTALGFVAVLTYFTIQASINIGALHDLTGGHPSVGACISAALAALPRVFVGSLLFCLAIFALTFVTVLLVYGIVIAIVNLTGHSVDVRVVSVGAALVVVVLALSLFVSWWVFVPCLVIEKAAPIACFGRSRRLTKGHRWGVLGIVLVVFVTNLACSMVIASIGRFGAIATAALLNVVLTLAFFALSSVLVAVAYTALRAEKEGFGRPDLDRIFD